MGISLNIALVLLLVCCFGGALLHTAQYQAIGGAELVAVGIVIAAGLLAIIDRPRSGR